MEISQAGSASIGVLIYLVALGFLIIHCGPDLTPTSSLSVEEGGSSAADLNDGEYKVDYAVSIQDCNGRTFISDAQLRQRIITDLEALDSSKRSYTRYFTLTSMYNGCVYDQDLELMRYGLGKL